MGRHAVSDVVQTDAAIRLLKEKEPETEICFVKVGQFSPLVAPLFADGDNLPEAAEEVSGGGQDEAHMVKATDDCVHEFDGNRGTREGGADVPRPGSELLDGEGQEERASPNKPA